MYFEDIAVDDWKKSHDWHDGITEHSRAIHNVAYIGTLFMSVGVIAKNAYNPKMGSSAKPIRTSETNTNIVDSYVDDLVKLKDENIYSVYKYKDIEVLEVMGPDGMAKIPPGVMVQINGQTYIQNSELFEITQIDPKGRSNLIRMEKGLAPIDKSGKPINLHHEYQMNNARRVEISFGEHKGKHSSLHQNQTSEIDHKSWNKERMAYWRERAKMYK